METFEEKCARNSRVQARYDALTQEGKHGQYESIFRIVREEVESAVFAAQQQLIAAQSSNEYLRGSVKHLQDQLGRYANPIVRQIVADVDGVDYMLQIISSDPTEGGLFVRVELPFKRDCVAKEGAMAALKSAADVIRQGDCGGSTMMGEVNEAYAGWLLQRAAELDQAPTAQ